MSVDEPSNPPEPATPPTEREPYEAPRLEQVEIVAGEAMLSMCKTGGEQGAFSICGGGCGAAGS
ncbi:MAG: hypothetical protein HY903_20915 [Deltaproteobacteria bacterium]|nr:hypothetical protein [Deltaproteobacteria bacterium]